MKPLHDRMAWDEATTEFTEYALLLGVVATLAVVGGASIIADLQSFWQHAAGVVVACLGAGR